MEKRITFSNIRATFLQDADTFTKMDPFLVFAIGQIEDRTETAHDAGKTPTFQKQITLLCNDTDRILVRAHEEDLTSNQFLGCCELIISEINQNGQFLFQLFDKEKNQKVGTVTCFSKVQKTKPPCKLIIKNVLCELQKKSAKYCFKIQNLSSSQSYQSKYVQGMTLEWIFDKEMAINSYKEEQLSLGVYDEDRPIFQKIFKLCDLEKNYGHRKQYIRDKSSQYLGSLSWGYELVDYQTQLKSSQKQEGKFYKIKILQINGNLKQSGEDIYFKICSGPTVIKTKTIQDAKKHFKMEVNEFIYLQKTQEYITIVAFDKDLISDDLLGIGTIPMNLMVSGEQNVILKNEKGDHFGNISVNIIVQQIVQRTVELSRIKIDLSKSGDIIGKSEPYVRARIGKWCSQTQHLYGQAVQFNRKLTLHFSQQKKLLIQICDEDVVSDDLMYSTQINIEDLFQSGQKEITLQKKGQNNQKSKISFIYNSTNIQKEQPASISKRAQSKKQIQKQQISKPEQPISKNQDKKNQSQQPSKTDRSIKRLNEFPEEKEKSQFDNDMQYRHSQNQNQKNRQPLKSPCRFRIHPERKRNFGDKIFAVQSSATLQKSILVYSMPKAPRFRNGPVYQGQPSYYVDTCFKNTNKGVGFGFGNKRQFPQWMQRNMKENPSPGAYFDHHESIPSFMPKGPSFGIAHHYYDKVTIPKQPKIKKIGTQRLKPLRQ